jgi:hypothetical protein
MGNGAGRWCSWTRPSGPGTQRPRGSPVPGLPLPEQGQPGWFSLWWQPARAAGVGCLVPVWNELSSSGRSRRGEQVRYCPAVAFRVRRWSAHRRPRTGSAGIGGSIRSHIASVISSRTGRHELGGDPVSAVRCLPTTAGSAGSPAPGQDPMSSPDTRSPHGRSRRPPYGPHPPRFQSTPATGHAVPGGSVVSRRQSFTGWCNKMARYVHHVVTFMRADTGSVTRVRRLTERP